jgi:hypothetical protein
MKDVYRAYLVKGASFTDGEEYPIIQSCNQIPEKVIPFSKTKNANDYNQVVHFYEPDYKFECFGNKPRQYLQRLKKFKAVITPDFSVYRNMPLVVQRHQTYLNRAFGFWLQKNGIPIIPNVRYGDERTYSFCFDGILPNSVIAIGTHGNIKKKIDIQYHIKGIPETIKQLKPQAILFYGAIVKDMEYILKASNITYRIYKSYISTIFRKKSTPIYPLFDILEEGNA